MDRYNVVWLALIAGGQLLLMAGLSAWIAARKDRNDAQRKSAEKAEDYARQDLVADRVAAAAQQAAHAAHLLVDAQKATIERTDEVARLVAESDTNTRGALQSIDEQTKKIHILVNSDMTAARTNERDQTRLTLIALKRVQALSASLGLVIDDSENQAIAAAEIRITELDVILADRLAAQHAADGSIQKEKGS